MKSIHRSTRTKARLFIAAILALVGAVAMAAPAAAAPIDPAYTEYNTLLKKHVKWVRGQKASEVDYTALAKDEAQLDQVLKSWSELTRDEFNAMSREAQMAFLINAYNGFTLKLILTEYPDLESIKDIGGFFSNPWKQAFFTLLGEKRTLDWIEHERLRPDYQDPRIHAAVNCASIGCPALQDQAFTAENLENLLETGMKNFLSDSTRNRVQDDELQVSMIFKWFTEDFENGFRGADSLKSFLALYAEELTDTPEKAALVASKSLPVSYLSYDWQLNDTSK